jgi:ubiquinone/menaquinone biosynthesis C-methylase UbiE
MTAVPTAKPSQPTPERILQMAWGYAPPLIIAAAVQHGLFDTLDAGPLSAAEIANRASVSPRGAAAVLNALAALQLLSKDAEQRYALTPESAAFLVSTKPSFQGGIFRHLDRQLVPKWLQLPEIVRTGRPAISVNQEQDGGKFFEEFVEDIFPMSYAAAQVLGDALKLADAKQSVSVLDLAAGSGVWGVALAQKSPQVRVTAVDWPTVIPVTRRVATRFGLADRFKFVEGDLEQVDFGRDHQIATLGHILHSEGEARSRQLLRRTAEALAPGGTIAIAEFVMNEERTGPPNAALFAVNMLVHTDQGNAFTFSEMSNWLKEAGFVNVRNLEAPAPSPLILADKPA